LPRHEGQTGDTKQKETVKIPRGRGETVLIVGRRACTSDVCTKQYWKNLGYQVFAAETPSEAILLANEHAGEIQLLITDVVMPEMNGRDLAERLHSLYPNINNLFMSGYTADMIAHRGVLDENVKFIQKPFSMTDFAIKVREAMKEK